MAPSVTSCISSAFCSHKQASWFLVATLTPFVLPFLIIAVPFLLLFLAPVSCLLVFFLLLYKVQVSIWSKCMLSDRHAHKGPRGKGYQPIQQIEAADRCDSQQQDPAEEGGRRYGIEGPALEEGGEERFHDYTSKEDMMGETRDIIEGPALEESGEGRHHEYSLEQEEPKGYNLQDGESSSAQVQEGVGAPKSHSPERESKEGKEITEEGLKIEHKQFPVCVDASMPSLPEDENRVCTDASMPSLPEDENRMLVLGTHENESISAFPGHGHRIREPFEEQGRHESSHTEPLEEAWRELPAKETTEAGLQAETADVVPSHIVEKPFTDLEIPQEYLQEEPESPSGKGMPNQNKDEFSQAESTERPELEEGEQSCSAHEVHWPWKKEAATMDDLHANRDEPEKNLAVGGEAVPLADEEEGPLSEESSFAGPPPHAVIHGTSEPQDRIQEEQKILADLDAIKKIVGYEGEPHASIMDQISALYLFLGMEPYYWAVEVDDFDKALAEIELLKVVVGVK